MPRWYNVNEALEVLEIYDITSSKQMVTRWLREGKIVGEVSANRKEGWRIHEKDLEDFIERMKPGLRKLFFRNEELQSELHDLREKVSTLEQKEKMFPIASNLHIPEDWKVQLQLSQKQSELLLGQVESLVKENRKLQEKNETLQKEKYLLIEEKIRLLDENKKLPLRKQKDKEIDSDREHVNNNVSQKNHMENAKVEKVTFDVFQEVLDKYLKEEITQQQEQVLYNYLLKQIFEEDGKLKESLRGTESKYYCHSGNKPYDTWKPFVKAQVKHLVENSESILKEFEKTKEEEKEEQVEEQ
ncbi:TPA: helix-turn-helix domain-containing protein [Bacillus cereus]|nr:helix-turn-helix domain-containing protein [Bacillus cereus]